MQGVLSTIEKKTLFQVRANQELFGPNSIAGAVEVPEWVRFTKCLFGGSSLFLWAATLLCFVNYSIAAGESDQPPMDNVYLGVRKLFLKFPLNTVREGIPWLTMPK